MKLISGLGAAYFAIAFVGAMYGANYADALLCIVFVAWCFALFYAARREGGAT